MTCSQDQVELLPNEVIVIHHYYYYSDFIVTVL